MVNMTGCIYLWHVYKTFRCDCIFAIHEIKVHIWCSLVSTIQEIVFFPSPFLNQFSSAKHIKLKVLRYKLELMKCLIKHSKCRIVNIYCLSHFLVPFTSSFRQGCARKILFYLFSSLRPDAFECTSNILLFLVCKFPASLKKNPKRCICS